jgi:hypothetical protein
MTDAYYHALLRWGFVNFCPGQALNNAMILLIAASQVAKVISMDH